MYQYHLFDDYKKNVDSQQKTFIICKNIVRRFTASETQQAHGTKGGGNEEQGMLFIHFP